MGSLYWRKSCRILCNELGCIGLHVHHVVDASTCQSSMCSQGRSTGGEGDQRQPGPNINGEKHKTTVDGRQKSVSKKDDSKTEKQSCEDCTGNCRRNRKMSW